MQDGKIVVRGFSGKAVSYVDAIRFTEANNLLGHGVFVSGSDPTAVLSVMDFETGPRLRVANGILRVVIREVEVDTETGR